MKSYDSETKQTFIANSLHKNEFTDCSIHAVASGRGPSSNSHKLRFY